MRFRVHSHVRTCVFAYAHPSSLFSYPSVSAHVRTSIPPSLMLCHPVSSTSFLPRSRSATTKFVLSVVTYSCPFLLAFTHHHVRHERSVFLTRLHPCPRLSYPSVRLPHMNPSLHTGTYLLSTLTYDECVISHLLPCSKVTYARTYLSTHIHLSSHSIRPCG